MRAGDVAIALCLSTSDIFDGGCFRHPVPAPPPVCALSGVRIFGPRARRSDSIHCTPWAAQPPEPTRTLICCLPSKSSCSCGLSCVLQMLSAADIEEDRLANEAVAAAAASAEARAHATFDAVEDSIRAMAEPSAIYIAKAERTGAIDFGTLRARIDSAAEAEGVRLGVKIEVTNSVPYSGQGGVTIFMMQTYHPSMVDIIINSRRQVWPTSAPYASLMPPQTQR